MLQCQQENVECSKGGARARAGVSRRKPAASMLHGGGHCESLALSFSSLRVRAASLITQRPTNCPFAALFFYLYLESSSTRAIGFVHAEKLAILSWLLFLFFALINYINRQTYLREFDFFFQRDMPQNLKYSRRIELSPTRSWYTKKEKRIAVCRVTQ